MWQKVEEIQHLRPHFGGLGSGFVWDYGKAGLLGKKGEADEVE
jgi:hypothetical protein